jgi:protein phosphatase
MVTEDDIEPEATVSDIEVRKGDILLLCSDGLTGELSDDEIRDIIANNIEDSASSLVARPLKRVVEGQARDNVSARICKIVQ